MSTGKQAKMDMAVRNPAASAKFLTCRHALPRVLFLNLFDKRPIHPMDRSLLSAGSEAGGGLQYDCPPLRGLLRKAALAQ